MNQGKGSLCSESVSFDVNNMTNLTRGSESTVLVIQMFLILTKNPHAQVVGRQPILKKFFVYQITIDSANYFLQFSVPFPQTTVGSPTKENQS